MGDTLNIVFKDASVDGAQSGCVKYDLALFAAAPNGEAPDIARERTPTKAGIISRGLRTVSLRNTV